MVLGRSRAPRSTTWCAEALVLLAAGVPLDPLLRAVRAAPAARQRLRAGVRPLPAVRDGRRGHGVVPGRGARRPRSAVAACRPTSASCPWGSRRRALLARARHRLARGSRRRARSRRGEPGHHGAAARARRRARCARGPFWPGRELIPPDPSDSFAPLPREGEYPMARAAQRPRRGRARPARRPRPGRGDAEGAVDCSGRYVYAFGGGTGRRPRRHEEPARRQGREPRRDGPPRPARARRLHDHDRGLHLLLRPRPDAIRPCCRGQVERRPARRSRRPLGKRFGDPTNPLLVSCAPARAPRCPA